MHLAQPQFLEQGELCPRVQSTAPTTQSLLSLYSMRKTLGRCHPICAALALAAAYTLTTGAFIAVRLLLSAIGETEAQSSCLLPKLSVGDRYILPGWQLNERAVILIKLERRRAEVGDAPATTSPSQSRRSVAFVSRNGD